MNGRAGSGAKPLSETGNPSFATVVAVLGALGMRLRVEAAE